MTNEEIKKYIRDYQGSPVYENLKLYESYYRQKNPLLIKRVEERERKHKTPNWCVPSAYYATVVDTMAGYLFSDVQLECADKAYEQLVKDTLKQSDTDVKDMKAGLCALAYNKAYELVYTTGDGKELATTQIHIASLDPLSVVPVYSDEIEPELTAIIWVRHKGPKVLADYIDKDIWQSFEAETEQKDFELVGQKTLIAGICPIAEYRAEMIGDSSPFDLVISYIEALDWAITGASNELDRVSDAILLLGKKVSKEMMDDLSELKALGDITKDELTPQFLEKTLSPEFRKFVVEMLIKEIYRHSHIVDWHAEQAMGEASAKALKIRLFDMDMFSKRIEKIFVEGMQKRLDIVGAFLKFRDSVEPQEIKITYKRTLPSDIDTMLQLLTGVDFLSDQTKCEMVGVDYKIEKKRLEGEKPEISIDDILKSEQQDTMEKPIVEENET